MQPANSRFVLASRKPDLPKERFWLKGRNHPLESVCRAASYIIDTDWSYLKIISALMPQDGLSCDRRMEETHAETRTLRLSEDN